MLDNKVRIQIDPVLNRVGRFLADQGITANMVTLAGFAIGIIAAVTIAFDMLWLGLALLLVSRVCDGLDGAVARANQKTDFGGYLDIVLDFAFYGLIPAAFIYLDPTANALAGTALLLAFYVNGASFLTFALMSEKQGISEESRGSKSLLYSVGLAEATETIGVFVLFCIFPAWFSMIAWIFCGIVVYTTVSRTLLARKTFR